MRRRSCRSRARRLWKKLGGPGQHFFNHMPAALVRQVIAPALERGERPRHVAGGFLGTDRGEMDAVGGQMDAFTGKESTGFYAKVLDEHLPETLVLHDELDGELRRKLAPLAGRSFLVFHPSWGYFAADYGLRQVAIELEPRLQREPADGLRTVREYLRDALEFHESPGTGASSGGTRCDVMMWTTVAMAVTKNPTLRPSCHQGWRITTMPTRRPHREARSSVSRVTGLIA